VEEESDRVGHAQLAQFPAERDQVVVVDPDQVVGPQQRRKRGGEATVDPGVAGVERAVVGGQVGAEMEYRPERRVGVAVVIFVVVGLLEVDGDDGDVIDAVAFQLAGECGRTLAAPAEPQRRSGAQGRAQRDGKAAGAGRVLGCGDTIGYDDKARHGTLRLARPWRPDALRHDPSGSPWGWFHVRGCGAAYLRQPGLSAR
jgi:hypothetical protein